MNTGENLVGEGRGGARGFLLLFAFVSSSPCSPRDWSRPLKENEEKKQKKERKKKFARDLSFNGHKTIITLTSVEYCKLRIVQLDGVMALLQTTEKLMKWIEVGVAISFSLVVLTFYI